MSSVFAFSTVLQTRALIFTGLLLLNSLIIYLRLGGLFVREIGYTHWRFLRKAETLHVHLAVPPSSAADVLPRMVALSHAATSACPAHTERHPAWVPESQTTGQSVSVPPVATTVFSDPLTFLSVQSYGLQPSLTSPLATGEEPRGTAWRGAEVRVMGSQSGPLKGASVRSTRDMADVWRRRDYHRSCLRMAGPHGTAHEVAGRGFYVPHTPPLSSTVTDRLAVLTHGLQIHAALQSWLASAPSAYGLPAPAQGVSGFRTVPAPFYKGPWIEDAWMATMAQPVIRTIPRSWYTSLSAHVHVKAVGEGVPSRGDGSGEEVVDVLLPYDTELFHPWVPLFIPWEAIMTTISSLPSHWDDDRRVVTAGQIKCDLARLLQGNMTDRHQYVTLAQRAAGPWLNGWSGEVPLSCTQSLHEALDPVLVLSSGGIGHVPLPLLAEEHPFLGCTATFNTPQARLQAEPSFLASFVGSHRPGARASLLKTLRRIDPAKDWVWWDTVAGFEAHGKQALLRRLGWNADSSGNLTKMNRAHLTAGAVASYALAPRGTGPTSFRLYEALQMGLVPVYVHDGQPWLPYLKPGESWTWDVTRDAAAQSLWARIGHVVHVDDIEPWLGALLSGDAELLSNVGLTRDRHTAQRRAIAEVRNRLFTYDGVLRRIAEWLDDPQAGSTLLACQGSSYL